MRLAAWLLSAMVWLACGRLTLDDGQANISGRLIDAHEAPVSGARVMLVRARRPVASTVSDADGRFSLTGTPGPAAAVLALASPPSREGAWRADLDLLPSGTTQLGDLTTQVVWAWPEMLWLRDTGLEEQLTHGGAHNYLGGGGRDVPLLTFRETPTHFVLTRIEDDGTEHDLLCEEGSLWSKPPRGGEPVPSLIRAWYARDDAGEPRVGVVNGGNSWDTAYGTVTAPAVRLRWLAVDGRTVSDVRLDPTARVVFGTDAVVENRADSATIFFASGRKVDLEGTFWEVFSVQGAHFLTDCQVGHCRVTRVTARGEVSTVGIDLLTEQLWVQAGEGVLRFLSRPSGQLVVTELDATSLTSRVATVPMGVRGSAMVPACESGEIAGFMEPLDTGLRLTTFWPTLVQRDFAFEYGSLQPSPTFCIEQGELWAVLKRGNVRSLVRTEGNTFSSEPFPWSVEMHIGGRHLLRDETPERLLWLTPPRGNSSAPVPLTRIPFVEPVGRSEAPSVLVASAWLSNGGQSLFRVVLPEVAP